MKTVKLASTGYLDHLPTQGNKLGQAFRDPALEEKVLELARRSGIGAQFGGKYFALDARVIRLPRHGASCPVGIGVSCSADRNLKARIDRDGIWIEELELHPERFIPGQLPRGARRRARGPGRPRPSDGDDPRRALALSASARRCGCPGPIIVARDIAHARIKERLDRGEGCPEYLKEHPIYYAGPAKTPQGLPSGSFGPTTAGRMDSYVDLFQSHGGSLIMIAKGNRSKAVTDAARSTAASTSVRSAGPPHSWPRRTSRRSSCSSTPSWAWRPSTRSRWWTSRHLSWSTTRGMSSSPNCLCSRRTTIADLLHSDGAISRRRVQPAMRTSTFPIGPFARPRERRSHILEPENSVHNRPLPRRIQTTDNLLPRGLCRLRGVVSDRNPADAIPPEQERCGIELRHDTAAPPDDADASALSQHRDYFAERALRRRCPRRGRSSSGAIAARTALRRSGSSGSRTKSAPSSFTFAPFAAPRERATTVRFIDFPRRTEAVPTPPEAPVTSSTEPSRGGAGGSLHCVRACQAVRKTRGPPAISSRDQPRGTGARLAGGNHHLLCKCSPDLHARAATQDAHRLADTHVLHRGAGGQDLTHTIAAQDVRQRRPGRVQGLRQESIRRIQRREPYSRAAPDPGQVADRQPRSNAVFDTSIGVHQPWRA